MKLWQWISLPKCPTDSGLGCLLVSTYIYIYSLVDLSLSRCDSSLRVGVVGASLTAWCQVVKPKGLPWCHLMWRCERTCYIDVATRRWSIGRWEVVLPSVEGFFLGDRDSWSFIVVLCDGKSKRFRIFRRVLHSMLEIHYPLTLKDALNVMTLFTMPIFLNHQWHKEVMVRWIYLGPHLQPRLHLEKLERSSTFITCSDAKMLPFLMWGVPTPVWHTTSLPGTQPLWLLGSGDRTSPVGVVVVVNRLRMTYDD